MSGTSAEEEFTTGLQQLYEAAGRPKYSALVNRAQAQRVKLRSSTLSDWLGQKASLPRDPTAVRFLVRHLEPLAARRGPYRELGDEEWIRRLQRAWDEKRSASGATTSNPPVSSPVSSPPSAGRAVPQQLPSSPDRFTGRTGVLAALDQLLRRAMSPGDGVVRPIVIAAVHGTGGVGKTALAVHWAHRVRDRFPDGQLFVNLRGYGPGEPMAPAAALAMILRSLEVPVQEIPADLDACSALFRSVLADRRTLIVLDNARDAGQVRPLLPGSSSLVVVTSRDQLRGLIAVDGAERIILNELQPAESVALLRHVLPTRQQPYGESALQELAQLCGHLPLALRIASEAVSRSPETGLEEVLRDLRQRHRLDVLDTEDPAASVRAVFFWSYQALDPQSARMFRLLGAHPGPMITLPAAAALIGTTASEARQLLDRLINAHLVERNEHGYEQHDLLRTYAAELADIIETPADQDAALRRVFGFYVHSSRNARAPLGRAELLFPIDPLPEGVAPLEFADDRQALAWFDTMRETTTAAVQLAADRGLDRLACQMAQALPLTFDSAWAYQELVKVQELGLASARRAGDVVAEANTTRALGSAFDQLGDRGRSIAHHQRAFELFAKAGSVRGQSGALEDLGRDYLHLGRYDEAVDQFARSIELVRRSDDQRTEARKLNNLAAGLIGLKQYDKAVAAARQAIDLCRGTNRVLEAYVWDTLGQALTGLGQHSDAINAYQQSLDLRRELGDRKTEPTALIHLARAQLAASRPADAVQNCQLALQVFDELGTDELNSPDTDVSRAEAVALLTSLNVHLDIAEPAP